MKEIKRTPVPLPGLVSKRPAPTPSKAPLSQEFVDSSDDSSNEPSPPPKAAAKPKTNIAVHRPKSNGLPGLTSKSTPKEKVSAKGTPKAIVPSKKPGLKKVVSEEQDESSSSSEESSDEVVEDWEAASRRNNGVAHSDSSSGSTSDSSSEDSEEEDDSRTAHNTVEERSRPTQSQTQSHAVEFRPVQPYVPPKGFSAVPTSQTSSSQAVKVFENLDGKQVWHITAPANVPIKELKEIAMDKALNGEAVLNYKDTDYGFTSAKTSEAGTREVLIPGRNGYKAVSMGISQTLHLRQVVRLPKLSSKQADQNTGSEAAASITRSTIRAPRPQVKGLKMRFFPLGAGSSRPETLGFSDSEDEALTQEPAGLGIPNGIHLPSKPEKRKHEGANGDERAESPTKKHKKHRTPEELKRKEEKKAKKERKRQKELGKAKS